MGEARVSHPVSGQDILVLRDCDLVPAAARGNPACVRYLHAKYHRYLVVCATVAALDPFAGEDAAMLVWQWLLEGRWRLGAMGAGHDGQLWAYAAAVARLAGWKERRRRLDSYTDSLDDIVRVRPSDEGLRSYRRLVYRLRSTMPTPEDLVLRLERRRIVASAFTTLTAWQLQVLEHRLLRGESTAAAGAALGRDRTAIVNAMAEARKRLRPLLDAYFSLPLASKANRQCLRVISPEGRARMRDAGRCTAARQREQPR